MIDDPHRLDGVRIIGVNEHCWRHPRAGTGTGTLERVVTVVIDLTPVRDGTGPARLLDLVEGRSKQRIAGVPVTRSTGSAGCCARSARVEDAVHAIIVPPAGRGRHAYDPDLLEPVWKIAGFVGVRTEGGPPQRAKTERVDPASIR